MKDLIKLANDLDERGLEKEADVIDRFIKSAGFLVDIGAWAAGKMDASTLADMAEQLPAEKLAEVARLMDENKQKQVVRLLVEDPNMQAIAAEALGVDAGLAQVGIGALKELGQLQGKGNSPEGGSLDLGDLRGLFPGNVGTR